MKTETLTPQNYQVAVLRGRITALEDRLSNHDCSSPSPHLCTQCLPVTVALNDLYRQLNHKLHENL